MFTEATTHRPHFAGILPADQAAPWYPWLVARAFFAPSELSRLQQELHALGAQKAAAERAAAELRQALEASQKHVADLIQQVDSLHVRENELRSSLLQVHEQLVNRDHELSVSFRELTAQRDALTTQRDALRARSDDLDGQMRRVRQSLPGRLYLGVRRALTLGKKQPG